ncbi:hypothetical protein PS467_09150 [Streptomyces luomodiensis]|uniref:Uncharacterized protein n=1 Tax=Streptomyces luomodiensis TaxID=3026192 RepID=A0ABY9USL3_9ACTN|nr:hypothetical protein [Streptomyces sp. SCA4-21]WNE95498.1 hypothetical protein PS467_09150 [Streptomyces sp. SCA4-21]
MNKAGHPADDPDKLAQRYLRAEKKTSAEIGAALADESCTQSSNLAAGYFTVPASNGSSPTTPKRWRATASS